MPDIEVHRDGDLPDDLADQGYAKQVLTDWVPEAGIGARKYDDLTAIGTYWIPSMDTDTLLDWIHEYTKERIRIRNLSSRPGIISRIKLAMDASQAWVILVCTGLPVWQWN